uniref:Uncharacterized protein n=1 Tax=Anguilla anguilla TaxID=7936 RepID=A0A0E9S5R9_ANGAN
MERRVALDFRPVPDTLNSQRHQTERGLRLSSPTLTLHGHVHSLSPDKCILIKHARYRYRPY